MNRPPWRRLAALRAARRRATVLCLIPGPNSTEMAIHVGNERAGWRGLVVAGTPASSAGSSS